MELGTLKFQKPVFTLIVLSITILFGFNQEASAAVQTLTDENAVVVIEDGAGGSNAGVTTFTVDGVDHMVQEAWWVQSTSVHTKEVPIASQGVDTVVATDEDSDGDDDKLVITFLQPNCFSFKLTFELTGGAPGSGIATLKETVQGGGICGGFLSSYHYTDFDAGAVTVNTSNRAAIDTVTQGPVVAPVTTSTKYCGFDCFSISPLIELGLASDLLGRLTDGDVDAFVDTPISSGL